MATSSLIKTYGKNKNGIRLFEVEDAILVTGCAEMFRRYTLSALSGDFNRSLQHKHRTAGLYFIIEVLFWALVKSPGYSI